MIYLFQHQMAKKCRCDGGDQYGLYKDAERNSK